jgi:hypothetical protein
MAASWLPAALRADADGAYAIGNSAASPRAVNPRIGHDLHQCSGAIVKTWPPGAMK